MCCSLLRLSMMILILVASAGCGLQSGFVRDAVTTQEFSYQMKLQSVRHMRIAEGTAQVGSLFCSIPMQDRLYARAMEDLHSSAKLKENEVLSNLREDQGTIVYLGLFCQKTVTISADVVLLTPEGTGGIGPVPMPPPSLP